MKKTTYMLVMVTVIISICLPLAGCAAGTASAPATNTPAVVTPAPSVSPLPSISADEVLDEDEDESSDEDEDEDEDEPAPTPPPLSDTKVLKTFNEDIDGDGGKETVSVAEQTVADPEGGFYNIFVYVQDGADTKGTYVDCLGGFDSAYMTEMDSGSACLILPFSSDGFSTTFFFSFSASAAVPEVSLVGKVTAVNGTEITIEYWGDTIGSWDYYQKFKLGDDFSLTATTEMIIMSRESLHTKKELPVWMLIDGVYKKTLVKAGEDIIPVSTDCASYLKFKLKDGSSGRINYALDTYNDHLIEGIDEEEYFDNIEYWH